MAVARLTPRGGSRKQGGPASYRLFSPEHEGFRRNLRSFVEKELAPHAEEWGEAEEFPRWAFTRMGELGFLGMSYP